MSSVRAVHKRYILVHAIPLLQDAVKDAFGECDLEDAKAEELAQDLQTVIDIAVGQSKGPLPAQLEGPDKSKFWILDSEEPDPRAQAPHYDEINRDLNKILLAIDALLPLINAPSRARREIGYFALPQHQRLLEAFIPGATLERENAFSTSVAELERLRACTDGALRQWNDIAQTQGQWTYPRWVRFYFLVLCRICEAVGKRPSLNRNPDGRPGGNVFKVGKSTQPLLPPFLRSTSNAALCSALLRAKKPPGQ